MSTTTETAPSPAIEGYIETKVREFAEFLNDRRGADVSFVFHEVVSQVRRMLVQALPPMSWQPIDTAPQDELVLVAGELDGPGDWRIKVGGFWAGEWHVFGASWKPTRWLRLPPGPDSSSAQMLAWLLSRAASHEQSGALTLTTTPPAAREQASIQCWSCQKSMTLEQRSDADGFCPYCMAEIELAPEETPLANAQPRYHFWDFTEARSASASTVHAKLKKGWLLHRVSHGHAATGGAANYQHALVGPAGELFKVSTAAVMKAGVSAQAAVLPLDMGVLLMREGVVGVDLTLEALNRGLRRATDLGARWNIERRRWTIRPTAASGFEHLLEPNARPVHMSPALELSQVSRIE